MDEIDIAEFNTREAAKFSLEGLKEARSRAHALLLVLLAGGGGLGALTLSQWPSHHLLSLAAGAGSCWWFIGAAFVAWRALTTESVTSWAPGNLLERQGEWEKYKQELAHEGDHTQSVRVDVVRELRIEAIQAARLARDDYRVASKKAYSALDQVYRAMALTPVVCAMAVIFYRLG